MKQGFVTLLAVIILGAVGVLIVSSLLLISTLLAQNDLIKTSSEKSGAFAEACLENALEDIRETTAFTGNTSLTFPEGNCTCSVSDLGGERRRIETTGSSSNTVTRIRVTINKINPQIVIESREKVADF